MQNSYSTALEYHDHYVFKNVIIRNFNFIFSTSSTIILKLVTLQSSPRHLELVDIGVVFGRLR